MPSPDSNSPLGLRTFAFAAIAAHLPSGSPAGPELEYLRRHLNQFGDAPVDWPVRISAYLQSPAPVDQPLLHLSTSLDLSVVELLTVALAAAVEEDAMAGRALAHVQAPVGGSRPTLGLIAAAFAEFAGENQNPIALLLTGTASRSGLLTILNDNLPLPERAVAVPTALCLALAGFESSWPGVSIGFEGERAVPLPETILEKARQHGAALLTTPNAALVLRTASQAEARSVAAAIARSMELRPAFLETDKLASIGPWLILRGLAPVFCLELAPGENRPLPAIPSYRGPILALSGPDGFVENRSGTILNWTIPTPTSAERAALWTAALGEGALADELALRHRHGAGRIAHLGRLARHRGALEGHENPTMSDVLNASWSSEGGGLDTLAQPLPEQITSAALVMPPALESELRTLLLRCRAREGLVAGLGPSASARYRQGVRALFVGPSGTGKTLAAGWLATELGMPLYRVDLASVTSKYIGETEKNLAQLLARAEQAEVILLFDEADSLFGKRTDVKDANDRFANAQTNYLLQRIETYDGITLLTSNSRARFDPAFSRRLDLIVEFPLPGPEERRALWQSHLGANHRLSYADLNRLSAEIDLAGGHIRNVVLAAAVSASEKQNRSLHYEDVLAGLIIELRKQGRQLPGGLIPSL